MPAAASIEELRKARQDPKALQERHPQPYQEAAALLRRHRSVGARNVCRLLLGEATAEDLKKG